MLFRSAGMGGPRPGVGVGAFTGPLTVRAMVHAAKAFIKPLAFVKAAVEYLEESKQDHLTRPMADSGKVSFIESQIRKKAH